MPQTPTSTSKSDDPLTIWTIGHSNRSQEMFLELLKNQGIEVLVDVRSFPTSKVEHFKREKMERWLPEQGIDYVWLGKELSGYRPSGYRRHMKTKLFKEGIKTLLEAATQKRICIMCMESDPKYCHRRYISAYLERERMAVQHILARGQKSLLKF